MSRLMDKDGAGYGSSTHLLWLATMGLKETYFTVCQRRDNDEPVIYNNGMRFVAIDLLVNMKRDNDADP